MHDKSRILHVLCIALFMYLPFTLSCEDDRHLGWERQRTIIGPIALNNHVVYVDNARDLAIIVDLEGETPTTRKFPIGRNAIFAKPLPNGTKIAIITRGEEALKVGQVDQKPALWILDTQSSNAEEGTQSYKIDSRFDQITISEEQIHRTTTTTYFQTNKNNNVLFLDNDDPSFL